MVGRRVLVPALALLAGSSGCARRGAELPPVASEPTATDRAVSCVRATAHAAGLHVRLTDPRDPYTMVIDRGGPGAAPSADVITVRIIPGAGADDPPMLMTSPSAGRTGIAVSSDIQETARRIDTRCGTIPGTPRS